MLKKLNNKGMTLVEVVVCFALVTILLASIYNSISVYKAKQNTESYKETVITYKNLLTKEIQDDLIKKGLISATVSSPAPIDEKYVVTMNFKDGDTKTLEITRVKAEDVFVGGYANSFVYLGDMNKDGILDDDDINGVDNNNDGDYIDEGEFVGIKVCQASPDLCDEIELKIADVDKSGEINSDDWNDVFENQKSNDNPDTYEIKVTGSSTKNDVFNITYDGIAYPFPDLGSSENDYGNTVYDLRINNVELSTENNILSIYIGFYHPELLTRYAIDIVCPINYS